MLYLGIDQPKRQLTVNLPNEDGAVILQRQVSTEWEKVRASLPILPKGAAGRRLSAILKECGINPWLLDMLQEHGCREIVVIQPTERSKQKTDRRDAGELGHLLWVHRQQFLGGKHPLEPEKGTSLILSVCWGAEKGTSLINGARTAMLERKEVERRRIQPNNE